MTESPRYTREAAVGYASQVVNKLEELGVGRERLGGIHTPGLDVNIATLRLVAQVARAIEVGSPIMVRLRRDELGGDERLLAIRKDRVREEPVILHIPSGLVVTEGDAYRATQGFTDLLDDPLTVLAPSMNLGEMQLEDGERTLDCA